MNKVVDVVNFNADASCLSNQSWLGALAGGTESIFYRWLKLYVENHKKVVIGFTGATVADIDRFNPDCLTLVNKYPDVFEIILRPFAHDISLLRSAAGFRLNLDLGIQTIRQAFQQVQPFYLPPEFMCNSSHIAELVFRGIEGVFLYPARFDDVTADRIPRQPFTLKGLMGTKICTLPIDESSSQAYLEAIHTYSADTWNQQVLRSDDRSMFVWRDGESAFLLPDTVNRESAWLVSESDRIQRCFLSELDLAPETPERNDNLGTRIQTYPIHSFAAWIQEMKMYWFISKVERIEEGLQLMDDFQQHLWLQVINSDILSAVEKRSPIIQIKTDAASSKLKSFTIQRQPKEYAGEEFFNMLTRANEPEILAHYQHSDEPHMQLLRERMAYLESLTSSSELK